MARFSFRRLSIRRKLLVAYVLASGVALLLASVALFTFQVASFRRELVRTLASQADVIGYSAASAIQFNDVAAARAYVNAALEFELFAHHLNDFAKRAHVHGEGFTEGHGH